MISAFFINRPVLANVLAIIIVLIGGVALVTLPVAQYPNVVPPTVQVTTTYPGASAAVVVNDVALPVELQVNGVEKMIYMQSYSTDAGTYTLTVTFEIGTDLDFAQVLVQNKVSAALASLPMPVQAQGLIVEKKSTSILQIVSLTSPDQRYDSLYLSNYATINLVNELSRLPGVGNVNVLGVGQYSMRVWLDPQKLAAYGLTAADVGQALTANDYIAGLGTTKGQMVQVTLKASTALSSLEEFRNLVLKQEGGAIVRLSDVANVTLGSDDYESEVSFDGQKAVYIGIQVAPAANLLDVIKGVRDIFPQIQAQLPQGLNGQIIYDSTEFVNSSIDEVIRTLIEALVIVTLVVFAFLGSVRSVIIPVIAIPLSLIGTFAMMAAFGFSINLLTLLALVLAIGLVVDDAIIVVENVNRHLEEGQKPFPAAIQAARELGGPIIAMTVVLIAVYVPIGFQRGLTGALFTEFAFTLVGAVTISAIVALTLSPMMCSRMLKPHEAADRGWEARLIRGIDRVFDSLRRGYSRWLTGSLNYLPVTATFAVLVLGSIFFLYSATSSELAPQEDQGIIIGFATSAPNSTIDQRQIYSREIYKIGASHPETDHVFQLDVPGQSIAGYVLKPWDKRTQTSNQLQPIMQQQLAGIAGAQVVAFQPPPLPGSTGLPIQFVINTTGGFDALNDVAQKFLQEALATGRFIFLNTDLKIDAPQATVVIDRDKAAQLGLKMSDIGGALGSMLGGGYVNYFALDGRSYKVIPQVQQASRQNIDQILDYHIKAADGSSVPLSTVAKIVTKAIPQSLNHFQQLNSATIQGVAFPGVSQAEALDTLKELAQRTLPQGYSIDYGGASRQYIQETGGFIVTFGFALIIIYLSLAALFESFRDPLIILFSVPMSIAGALIFLMALSTVGMPGATLNIYTQVGLVTLMGLISKHGILIVEVANELQEAGKSRREAILEAAAIRLRPILMTTAAMVLGVVPLIVATGAGALSRFSMGLVIASGLAVGTLFTLFVVPAVYVMLAADHSKKRGDEPLTGVPAAGD